MGTKGGRWAAADQPAGGRAQGGGCVRLRWGVTKAQRRKGVWLGNEKDPSLLQPGIFTLGSTEKGRAPKESIFSYGKDTSLDKLNMAGLPLRTSIPQQAQSEHQEREGPRGQEVL